MAARDLTRNTPTEDQKQSKVGEDTSGLPARQQHRFDSTPHDSTSARPSEASTAANEDQSPNDKSSAVVGSEDDFGAGDDKDGLVKSTILQADYGYIVSFPGVCEIAISIFALIALILCVVPYQWGPQFGYFLFAAVFTLSSAMVLLFTKVCLATHHVKLFYRIYVCLHLGLLMTVCFVATVLASDQTVNGTRWRLDVAMAVFMGTSTVILIMDFAYNLKAYFF